jgi:hypothetical protein
MPNSCTASTEARVVVVAEAEYEGMPPPPVSYKKVDATDAKFALTPSIVK